MKQPSIELFKAWLLALDDKEFWEALNALSQTAEQRTGDSLWYL